VSDPFATATELAQFIGASTPTDLGRMQMLLGIASAEIRGCAGQVLSPVVDDVVVLQPSWTQTLFLPERPVTAVTTVTVNAATYLDYRFTASGHLIQGADMALGSAMVWSQGATVTYSHGYAESTEDYKIIKGICLEAASRAYTMNERSASEVLGATILESAGYAPEVFLTEGEKMRLSAYRPVLVG
jgi:hypothetical protein